MNRQSKQGHTSTDINPSLNLLAKSIDPSGTDCPLLLGEFPEVPEGAGLFAASETEHSAVSVEESGMLIREAAESIETATNQVLDALQLRDPETYKQVSFFTLDDLMNIKSNADASMTPTAEGVKHCLVSRVAVLRGYYDTLVNIKRQAMGSHYRDVIERDYINMLMKARGKK
ncbi:hypothetical protein [Candidatus Sororendozoicomonas aggregata]|uniref:hypothetical protein n=1 Tax=Candidatus Sororendozoicomonas aggregata TaxID=3073239 RepID=UPI002ED1DA33